MIGLIIIFVIGYYIYNLNKQISQVYREKANEYMSKVSLKKLKIEKNYFKESYLNDVNRDNSNFKKIRISNKKIYFK